MPVTTQLVLTEETVINEIRKQPKKFFPLWNLHWRALLAEMISTAFLLLLGCMTCIPVDGVNPNPQLYSALGFGLIILVNVHIFGHISGAHMNPAVTLAAVIWGKMSSSLGIAYVIAQCVGAILGYGILMEISTVELAVDGVCVTQPHVRHSVQQALLFEILMSAGLLLIVCAVWDPVNEEKTETNSIKFGLTVCGLAISGGPLNGASLNPARSLAPAIWTGRWNAHWVYWVGPLLGSTLATTFYKYVWVKVDKINVPKVLPLIDDIHPEL